MVINGYNILEIILILAIGILMGLFISNQFYPTITDLRPQRHFDKIDNSLVDLSDYEISFMTESPSMLPSLPGGSHVIIDRNVDKLYVGDIVVFDVGNITFAHRIIQIKNNKYITKGDNVKYEDDWILEDSDVLGKIVGVFY